MQLKCLRNFEDGGRHLRNFWGLQSWGSSLYIKKECIWLKGSFNPSRRQTHTCVPLKFFVFLFRWWWEGVIGYSIFFFCGGWGSDKQAFPLIWPSRVVWWLKYFNGRGRILTRKQSSQRIRRCRFPWWGLVVSSPPPMLRRSRRTLCGRILSLAGTRSAAHYQNA